MSSKAFLVAGCLAMAACNKPVGTGEAATDAGPTACGSDVTPAPGIVVTDTGAVRGAQAGATWSYKGIPYAAPPVGALRWKAPQPMGCWSGVRDALDWAAQCSQSDATGTAPVTGSEDCLTVNVWTPQDPPATPRPVLVFVHGGGHVVGSASTENSGVHLYDGQALVEKADAVVVTFNYRLGALGYLAHQSLTAESGISASGDYGTLDQIAALGWVQRNIAAFGGDPTHVLLFGESAGAVAVCTLVASPLARGLFSAALMESGACVAQPLAQAETFGARVFEAAGCQAAADPLACMRALSAEQVVAAYPVKVEVAGAAGGYGSVIEGHALTGDPEQVIASGGHNHVPMIVGSNSDETSRSVPPIATEAEYEAAVRAISGGNATLAAALLAAYPAAQYPSPRAAYVALTTDAKFTCTARRAVRALVAGQSEPAWRYFFNHPLDNASAETKAAGSWHGLELTFVFDHLDIAGYQASLAEKALADEMIHYWTRLAAAGDPNGGGAVGWPRADASDPYLALGDTIEAKSGLRERLCDFWDQLAGR